MGKLTELLLSLKDRTVNSKKTTIGGGVAGVAFAAFIGYLEEQSGCKFAVAFGNIDYVQLAVYMYSQVAGAVTTDANKTVTPTAS